MWFWHKVVGQEVPKSCYSHETPEEQEQYKRKTYITCNKNTLFVHLVDCKVEHHFKYFLSEFDPSNVCLHSKAIQCFEDQKKSIVKEIEDIYYKTYATYPDTELDDLLSFIFLQSRARCLYLIMQLNETLLEKKRQDVIDAILRIFHSNYYQNHGLDDYLLCRDQKSYNKYYSLDRWKEVIIKELEGGGISNWSPVQR